MPQRRTWDIFCTVVDNYGDIGVTWRLARQIAAEHGRAVRLWVDDPASFARIAPGLDPALDTQVLRGVQVRHWANAFPGVEPGDAVVEAFACHLPENHVVRMAQCASKPAWINLEYLSAEKWVTATHALPSPHARLPLTKYFFFPGFSEKTGGLLRERDLLARRDAFQRDRSAQAAFWQTLGLAPAAENELRVLLFCYANPALPTLLKAWVASPVRVTCLFPEGPALPVVRDYFGEPGANQFERGNLRMHVLPFIEQDDFDKLLWACDVNFVRGEDSFVRAQWAGRPFVWHIYPQDDDAHWPKLEAFLDLHTAGADLSTAARIRFLWHAWNRGHDAGAKWHDYLAGRATIATHSGAWAARLTAQPDLAAKLVNFCDNLL